ncbi:hypothetical protein PHJA_000922700 [Phtheirospermum japonicum]|uniref:Uncharacterized protein n=1 Tax=Phtheirospermum japonicum TaxID=374723 RepID=A0A830BJL0_9LAMI|nr:hypothetical protein PHJA_000922700 [Phtheirospermum japonicum]
MFHLHTSLHFHLTPIVTINDSSRRDLLLNSQNCCRSMPVRAETRRCLGCATGSSGEVGIGEHSSWGELTTYAFSSYPFCTWLSSVYRGHDN